MFREAVLAFLGAGETPTAESAYCAKCRQLGEADCAHCDQNITPLES